MGPNTGTQEGLIMKILHSPSRHLRALGMIFCIAAFAAVPANAQNIESIDPNSAIDADLAQPPAETVQSDWYTPADTDTVTPDTPEPSINYDDTVTYGTAGAAPPTDGAVPDAAAGESTTYKQDDLIGAAEGVFGKGAKGLAGMIENILSKQGEPNAYIVGREAGAALVIGARYGSGTLYHKVEGERPVYWTGPSIGFDAGANAGNTFVLVYNLYDSEDLYTRYPAGEGQAYFIGGLHASYLRKGDVVMIPIRVGAGLRLGVNAGYMKFTKKQTWLPF